MSSHQEPEAVRSQSNSSASLGTLGPRTPFPASPWVPVRLSRLQPGALGRAGRLPGLELRSPRLSEQHGRLKGHLGPLSRREPGAAVCSASVTVSVGWGGTSQRGHAELLRRLPVRARESSGPGSVPSSSYSESWKVAFLKWLIPAWELGMFSPAVLMSLLGGRRYRLVLRWRHLPRALDACSSSSPSGWRQLGVRSDGEGKVISTFLPGAGHAVTTASVCPT